MLDSVLKKLLKIMKFSNRSSGGANNRDCYKRACFNLKKTPIKTLEAIRCLSVSYTLMANYRHKEEFQ